LERTAVDRPGEKLSEHPDVVATCALNRRESGVANLRDPDGLPASAVPALDVRASDSPDVARADLEQVFGFAAGWFGRRCPAETIPMKLDEWRPHASPTLHGDPRVPSRQQQVVADLLGLWNGDRMGGTRCGDGS